MAQPKASGNEVKVPRCRPHSRRPPSSWKNRRRRHSRTNRELPLQSVGNVLARGGRTHQLRRTKVVPRREALRPLDEGLCCFSHPEVETWIIN